MFLTKYGYTYLCTYIKIMTGSRNSENRNSSYVMIRMKEISSHHIPSYPIPSYPITSHHNFHVQGHTMNPPINTNPSSFSGAVGSQVTVEYCRTGLGTTYPPQTSQSTPAASQSTPPASQSIPAASQSTPATSQNISPPSLSFQHASIYLNSSQPLQSKDQTISTPLQPSNITIVPLTNSQRFNFSRRGLTPEQTKTAG